MGQCAFGVVPLLVREDCAAAWNRADWRRGSLAQLGYIAALSRTNPARCKIIIASCNILESWASRVNQFKRRLALAYFTKQQQQYLHTDAVGPLRAPRRAHTAANAA